MPEQSFFSVGSSLQGISGQGDQVIDPPAVEIGQERSKLVTQHALWQTNLAGHVVGFSSLIVAFKIHQVGAQVEPGEGVL
jgi:hypothetical protein